MDYPYIARGSLNETINHLITARDLDYVADDRYRELYDLGAPGRAGLNGYIGYVRRRKSGHEMYGDKYVPDPDQTPQSPNP